MSEPFDSLSVVCRPSSPRSVVSPMSIGRVCIQSRYASRTLSRSKPRWRRIERASVSAISLSSVGWPAMVWYRPPLASSRTPRGKSRAISVAILNSTCEPRLSPITWPSSTPCARSSHADFRGKPSTVRGSRRGSCSTRFQSYLASWRAACGAPAKTPLMRVTGFPCSTTSRASASSTTPFAAAMSAMPAATSYSLTPCIDTVATPSPAAMRAMR